MTKTARMTMILGSVLLLSAALVACGGGSQDATPATTSADETAPSGQSAPVAAAPLGSAKITGTVKYDGQIPPLRPVKMDADPGCAKKHTSPVQPEVLVLGEGNTMAHVMVRVTGGLPAQKFAPPAEPAVIDQDGCQYKPHVLALMVGQKLRVENSDGLLHNVHALPQVNASFNRAMPATVTEFEHTFDKPEAPFKIKCDVHPWMGAFVAVLEHPYHAVTLKDGRFEIAGLPAGTYEIEAWHERLGTRQATVTVADGESKATDFTFTM